MHRILLVLHGLLLARLVTATAVKLTLAPASTRTALALHAVTTQSHRRYAGDELFRRDATESELITCGYLNGNVDFPRTAQPGFDCRVDTAHGIWGFCPSTVIAATDCGLAAACRDGGTCSSICRFNAASGLTTITW
ncbi:hypothetical protein SEUCBS140593_007429 [Sporothrix eucalyptigena]|uniref:Uncharacterized protein n=1 Tax=Sporothrix eucalyptigena TaxID=1812306 RepID=A0ABP0CD62_9PEZI